MKIALVLIIVIVLISGCTTVITHETEKVINPVFVEKTISDVEISYLSLHCFDENDTIIDPESMPYDLYLDDYVTRSAWEGDWLKTTIHYPIIDFFIDIYDVQAEYGECDFHGSIKITIEDSNDVPYSEECRIESDMCIIDECRYKIQQQIQDCLGNIE